MFHLQLAWLDGVIKMTDDERTDLKPQEEGEVRKLKEAKNMECYIAIFKGEEVRSKPEIPMLNPLPEESVQVTK